MENNEIMTANEFETEEIEIYVEPEESGNGIVGKIVTGGVIVAVCAGVAYWWNKNKSKREARTIEKLRQKGYTIYEPDAVSDVEDVEAEEI